jgi:outer membrane protein OmpA-like peptidoglycan-associated protein
MKINLDSFTRNLNFARYRINLEIMRNHLLLNIIMPVAIGVSSFANAQSDLTMTKSFYFDTNVSNRLSQGKTFVLTEDDKVWTTADIKGVKVLGYADCQGNPESNMSLSMRRARFVEQLIKKSEVLKSGISVEVSAKGELPCVVDGPAGDQENRRVDMIITYQVKKQEETKDLTEIIKKDGKVDMVGVNFQPGRHYFLPGVERVLDQFAESLKQNPNVKIMLRGHICCQPEIGDGPDIDTGLNNLSEARAKEVYDYLIKKGIAADRMKYSGVGNRHPKVWPERSADDMTANRRVEAILLE